MCDRRCRDFNKCILNGEVLYVALIAKREYPETARSRGFLVVWSLVLANASCNDTEY